MWQGTLLSIHTAVEGRAPMEAHDSIKLIEGLGLEGDRYATGKGKYSQIPDIREVTLIEKETLVALERDHGVTFDADEHRRNLTVSGVPLNHLVGQRFVVGDTLLLAGRLNTPCRYLDLVTDKAVCDLLRHRSGLNCSIVRGDTISVGDTIRPE
ncbi:MOSC domain-containing protein [uncultured Roseobacter sp.]|uniref:MOSC domain-containing protein n=1 Tax=uncultured Roseobacter sp. TaxID=114847 RepID=UPI002624D1F9|nr:MOSC domain-containing protein [uncultured Roseobacter sp.]